MLLIIFSVAEFVVTSIFEGKVIISLTSCLGRLLQFPNTHVQLDCHLYRIHIILQYFDIAKLTTIRVYGVILIVYLSLFWKTLRETPLGIMITAFSLIIIAVLIDSFYSYFPMKSLLIEGVPKLLGMINFTLYFCLVCYQTILNTWKELE